MHGRPQNSIEEILQRLDSAEPGPGWVAFLERYSPTIMHVAAQYVYDNDRRQDCYLFICEKLCDNGFRRLLKYCPSGRASFGGWLRVVVANLCIDWKRQQQGRVRPFKSIRSMSRLDQAVFKYRFLQRMDPFACLARLETEFPGVGEPQLAGAIHRINASLTQNQRWLLSTRSAEPVCLETVGDVRQACPDPDPAEHCARSEQVTELKAALKKLSRHHRLLIRLRYQQDLSLKEIARLTRLGDPFRARRQIQAALKELTRILES